VTTTKISGSAYILKYCLQKGNASILIGVNNPNENISIREL